MMCGLISFHRSRTIKSGKAMMKMVEKRPICPSRAKVTGVRQPFTPGRSCLQEYHTRAAETAAMMRRPNSAKP
jgi:hypothetical protein